MPLSHAFMSGLWRFLYSSDAKRIRIFLPAFILGFMPGFHSAVSFAGLPLPASVVLTSARSVSDIGGGDVFLYSGTFHYFRCPEPLWRDRLLLVKEANLNCISVPVPWSMHETGENRFQMRQLENFLNLCAELGFQVILEAGPYIDADLDAGGFPAWLIAKRVRLRSNDPDYIGYVRKWFRVLLGAVRPFLVTEGGPITLIQIENNLGAPAEYKEEYLRTLREAVDELNPDIPVVTCNSANALDNSDAGMRAIHDSPAFESATRFRVILREAEAYRILEPSFPLFTTRMETGSASLWIPESKKENTKTGKYSIGTRVNAGIAAGLAAINICPIFGGTNFGYMQDPSIATSYDHEAPIREWGDAGVCYHELKLTGEWLKEFGPAVLQSTIADLRIAENESENKQNVPLWAWKFRFLHRFNWETPELAAGYDDSDWEELHPGNFGTELPRDSLVTIIYRTTCELNAEDLSSSSLYLHPGYIMGAHYIFVNGSYLKSGSAPGNALPHAITDMLHAGKNEFAVVQRISTKSQAQALTWYDTPASAVLSSDKNSNEELLSIEKTDGKQIFFFLHNPSRKAKTFRLKYFDPIERREMTLPSRGELTVPAEKSLILNGNVALGNAILRHSSSRILGILRKGKPMRLILYGEPGTEGEALFTLPEKPEIRTNDRIEWDDGLNAALIHYVHSDTPYTLPVSDSLSLTILSTRAAEGSTILPGKGIASYLFSSTGLLVREKNMTDAALTIAGDIPPGARRTASLQGGAEPSEILIDGKAVAFTHDKINQWTEFTIQADVFDFEEIQFHEAKFHREDFSDLTRAESITLQSLEYLGDFDPGYKIYHTAIDSTNADSIIIEMCSSDTSRRYPEQRHDRNGPGAGIHFTELLSVFLNGEPVPCPEISGSRWSGYIAPRIRGGINTLVIADECCGRPSDGYPGAPFENFRGPIRVYLKQSGMNTREIRTWNFKRNLDGQAAGYYLPEFSQWAWKSIPLGNWKPHDKLLRDHNGVVWYRLNFDLNIAKTWRVPLTLDIQAKSKALIYLNGNFLGRYHESGSQSRFYLPECWLNGNGENNLTLAVMSEGDEGGLYRAAIRAVTGSMAKKCIIEILFQQ